MTANWDYAVCGESFLPVVRKPLGECFVGLTCIIPSHFLLAFLSSCLIGKRNYHLFSCRSVIARLKIFIAILLFLCPPSKLFCLRFVSHSKLYIIDYIIPFTESLCWTVFAVYITTLKRKQNHLIINVSFLLCFAVACINLKVVQVSQPDSKSGVTIRKIASLTTIVIEIVYLLVSLADHLFIWDRHVRFRELQTIDTSVRENHANSISDAPFLPITPLVHETMGTAETSNIFSSLFFWWVWPLMKKGYKNLIQSVNDLYNLPCSLRAITVHSKFYSSWIFLMQKSPDQSASLFQTFNLCFGYQYYLLGIVKFASDCLAFAGPLLLSLILSFLENYNAGNYNGYYYALALFGISFLGLLGSTNYNYWVNRVGLKLRTALMISVYQKTLNVSQFAFSEFDSGEIINFMSTDVDRIVNFCPSFHQFWSLPIQVIITLCLLYKQIGYSFLVGIIFAILIVPLNHYIAKKIVYYSQDMMKAKDLRIKLMNEILNGMKMVKMQAWEDTFSQKIGFIREKELNLLKKRKYLDAFCVYFWATTPVIISFLSFTTFALLGNTVTSTKIFTSISLFNMLIVPLNAFPWVINGLLEAWISLRRIQRFLNLPELELKQIYSEPQGDIKLQINEGIFAYKRSNLSDTSGVLPKEISQEPFFLGPINLTLLKGKFLCIVGKVGCGKSTLLSSILSDVPLHSGSICLSVHDLDLGIGLVTCDPWIQQASIRDNILFGKAMNSKDYYNVLEACCLHEDLKTLPHGDNTEVGEKGITLSGGQKARIALARTVYQDVDLYLLDNPLSAVDVHVADHLYNDCILGLLKNKTRIMCTNNLNFVEKADFVVYLEKGRIIRQGAPRVIIPYLCLSDEKENNSNQDAHNDCVTNEEAEGLQTPNQCFVQEEEKDSGVVKSRVYKSYWKAVGSMLSVIVLGSCFAMQASKTVSDWWLSYWIASTQRNFSITSYREIDSDIIPHSELSIREETKNHETVFYLSVYGGLILANTIFAIVRAFSFAYSGIKAAASLHRKLLKSIVMAPIHFFCVTPIGRILNRFSSDVYNTDDTLPFNLNILLAQTFGLFGSLAVTLFSLPWIAFLFVPLALIYHSLQGYYRHTSRELKRLSSITLSPIYNHFSETLSGCSTIRALSAVSRFNQEAMEKVDTNQRAMFCMMATSQWLNLWLQCIGVVVVSSVAFIAVFQNQFGHVDAGLVGLALSYALAITGLLNGFLTSFIETEKEMVSVERIVQYINDIPSEGNISSHNKFLVWGLEKGVISFNDVILQYETDSAYALNCVTFETKPAEKLGIVGRTGSGKSSLIQALFRMVDIKNGKILIDGIDISELDLSSLRHHLAVVPQDPFLFNGSVRENLDPNCIHCDLDIWNSIKDCHMTDKVLSLGGLDAEVEEKGKNLSAGEKQLLCLARTLLQKSKILCLDEATANVDHQTDSLIQNTIRMAFRNSTVLVIAHRIETVMDCNRVLVMKNGGVVELDQPSVLLANPSSEFYKLAYAVK